MEVDIDAPRKRQAEERQSGATPSKQRAVTFDVPPTSSASLGSTVKSAPAYFDMAITGLPNHSLYLSLRTSKPNKKFGFLHRMPCRLFHLRRCLEVNSRELGVSLQKVPSNVRAVRSLSGILRGFMSKELESKTDFHGYAHLDDVKRELLTGRFHKEVSSWLVETFMSIAAFDEKDRFELLTAIDIKHSVISAKTVPFKIRCVQGHQEQFWKNRSPTIGASRVFCAEHRRDRYPKRLTEGGLSNAPPRIFHRTSNAAAMEIIPHGLIPGGSGVSQSGRRDSYLSPYQVGDAAYKFLVRANQPIEVACDTEL